MKEWKVTTMPVTRGNLAPKEEFLVIFEELIKWLKPYENLMQVRNRSETNYELWTLHAFRTKTFRPKAKKGVLFAGVAIFKHHVGFYFYPLHIEESLRTQLPDALRNAVVGRSTFHIKKIDQSLADEFNLMIKVGVQLYQDKGWVPAR